MNQIGGSQFSIEQLTGGYLKTKQPVTVEQTEALSFEQILSDKRESNVTFSKHANERLSHRNIELDASQMKRLNDGIEQARNKNINESLVMLDDLAFIVNVKNNTVVTALDQGSEEAHVFTNIDGAVII